MILYHASQLEVIHPEVTFSRNALDFGKGFYLTLIEDQARNYGRRFTSRGLDAYLNVYEFILPENKYRCLHFNAYDEEWLDFVCNCRAGKSVKVYDVVSGGIANDNVFNTLDLYLDGLISKQEALGRLSYEKPNHQLCILNQEVINSCLHFVKSIKL